MRHSLGREATLGLNRAQTWGHCLMILLSTPVLILSLALIPSVVPIFRKDSILSQSIPQIPIISAIRMHPTPPSPRFSSSCSQHSSPLRLPQTPLQLQFWLVHWLHRDLRQRYLLRRPHYCSSSPLQIPLRLPLPLQAFLLPCSHHRSIYHHLLRRFSTSALLEAFVCFTSEPDRLSKFRSFSERPPLFQTEMFDSFISVPIDSALNFDCLASIAVRAVAISPTTASTQTAPPSMNATPFHHRETPYVFPSSPPPSPSPPISDQAPDTRCR